MEGKKFCINIFFNKPSSVLAGQKRQSTVKNDYCSAIDFIILEEIFTLNGNFLSPDTV